ARAHPADRHDVDDAGRLRAGELLVEDGLLHDRQARAAVLLRPGDGEEPSLVELPLPLLHLLEAVALRGVRHVLGDPRADAGAERFLFRRVREIHRPGTVVGSPTSCYGAAWARSSSDAGWSSTARLAPGRPPWAARWPSGSASRSSSSTPCSMPG